MMKLSFASLAFFYPAVESAIFPASLQTKESGECINGWMGDLRGEASYPATLTIEENVLSQEECQQLIGTTSEEDFDQGETVSGSRFFKKIEIEENIYNRIRDPSLARDGKLQVPISRILKSSRPHRDGYYHNEALGVPHGALVDEEVAILFLNDNPDANFVYGNDRVPVKCGTKVSFNGGYTHNTELTGGVVKFLGPLTLSSGLYSADYAGQCEDGVTVSLGAICSCTACDIENGFQGTFGECEDSCCDDFTAANRCVEINEYSSDPSLCPEVQSTKSTKAPKDTKSPTTKAPKSIKTSDIPA